jgi:tetratricopeptide (TPR) repeat protein
VIKLKLISKLIVYIFPLIAILVIISHVFTLGIILLIIYFLWVIITPIKNYRPNYALVKGINAYKKGNIDEAIRIYKKAYENGKMKVDSIFIYAYFLIKEGKLSEFEEILESLSNKELNEKEKIDLIANRALLHIKRGELLEAKDILEEEIKVHKNTVIYGNLGYVYILMDDLTKALEFNLQAFEFNSTDMAIQDNLGQTYLLIKEYDKAEEIYIKLMEQKPNFPGCYYNYGLVLEALNKNDLAIEMYKKALGFNFNFLSNVDKKDIEKALNRVKS